MEETPAHTPVDRLTLALRWILGFVIVALLIGAAAVAYAFLSTPPSLRHPVGTHYHFRMQIIAGGQAVNFADTKYQTEFNKDICSAKLTKQPFHFHDSLDQFTHVHWGKLTGGLLLKNYGWNLIGGAGNTLGYRFDQLPLITRIPTHSRSLPALPAGTHYFIYTGDKDGYQQRDWSDFLHQDLETFFRGRVSARSPLQNLLAPTASAHSEGMTMGGASHSEEELIQLNHVIGNVVIFAQAEAPTPAQIKDRFSRLIPLPESTCGG